MSAIAQSILIAQSALDLGFVPIGLKGKRPILPGWQHQSRDSAVSKIGSLSRKGDCNVGILTGRASGVVVVDVDVKDGGVDEWCRLIEIYGEPQTMKVKTGGGGYHYYFRYEPRVGILINGSRLINGKGIDFKTDGGQVVFPGSIHPDTGKVYEWRRKDKIDLMPEWLLDLLRG